MPARYSRLRRIPRPLPAGEPDRLRCSVCRFPGVDRQTVPGASLTGSTAYEATGSTYTVAPGQDVSGIDADVFPRPNPAASCPFCGAELFLTGRRGSGHRVPA